MSHINQVIAKGKNPNHTNILLMAELQIQLKRFAQALNAPETLTEHQAKIMPFSPQNRLATDLNKAVTIHVANVNSQAIYRTGVLLQHRSQASGKLPLLLRLRPDSMLSSIWIKVFRSPSAPTSQVWQG